MLADVDRFRRFARAVTTEVGALDNSFLGRGRPLGAARVLNAIGGGRTDVAKIREFLGLDSGLMSRLLRSLEEEGLVVTRADPRDARQRITSLTQTGVREYRAYEDLSNARANALLSSSSRSEALLEALDFVASVLTRDQTVIRLFDPRSEEALHCLSQYYQELASTFDQGFDVKRSRDPRIDQLMAPKGAFLVAVSDCLPIGCVGLKGNGGQSGEIKRLWVSPSARGWGLGTRLMHEIEGAARLLGISTLRLDTNKSLPGASELYRRLGWREIDRFNDDPYADFFFEKTLQPTETAPFKT